ncbi:HAD family hydrolase [Floricoccus tropicus]|uniref:HAD family hydrolase n=1 Tax=Floricoccus tropicus TaxID=1859473 RepID=A0A1E8GIV8_9LACT|nr:HAD family phosphatase [Floricoccus tropicus]OFI48175.1 HAD family hydrolase [Floricoccus tropicus]
MKNIKAVIFDMDGLIFDTESIYYRGSQEVADELGIPYDAEVYNRFLGVGDSEIWATYHQMYDEEFGSDLVNDFIKLSYERVVDYLKSGVAEMKPGLLELLSYLEENNIPKIVASSNNKDIIEDLLKKNNLFDRFSNIVSVEDVKNAKPDPEIFNKAHEVLGIDMDNLLILEDSNNGVIAGHAAGIPVIMIPDLIQPDEELRSKTIAVLDSLADVPAFIEDNK